MMPYLSAFFFFFNSTATTEIYTLSLHDALPILFSPPPALDERQWSSCRVGVGSRYGLSVCAPRPSPVYARSEEHTSELQSRRDLVCRLLLEKKNTRPSSSRTEAAASSSRQRRDT